MQWQKELYQYQEIPPPHCWQEVQKQMTEEPIMLGAMLHEASETPPASVWDAIERDIRTASKPAPAPVRAFKRPYLSYAAAVAGLLLLGSLLLYVANQRSTAIDMKDLAAGISLADSQKQQKESDTASTNNPAPTESRIQTAPMPEVRGQETEDSDKTAIALQNIAASDLTNPKSDAGPASSPGTVATNTKVLYTDGNYIQLVKPNGEITRVSYKLAGMVKTMQGKKAATAEQKKWASTLDQWKSKLEQSNYAPAGSNFFDIAGMIEVMEAENR
jgi:hypothetical protein